MTRHALWLLLATACAAPAAETQTIFGRALHTDQFEVIFERETKPGQISIDKVSWFGDELWTPSRLAPEDCFLLTMDGPDVRTLQQASCDTGKGRGAVWDAR